MKIQFAFLFIAKINFESKLTYFPKTIENSVEVGLMNENKVKNYTL
jgi:hypothetical protein